MLLQTSHNHSRLQGSETITFGALSGQNFGDPDFAVTATASSGLAVSFAASGNCTAAGSTIHLTGQAPVRSPHRKGVIATTTLPQMSLNRSRSPKAARPSASGATHESLRCSGLRGHSDGFFQFGSELHCQWQLQRSWFHRSPHRCGLLHDHRFTSW